MAKVGESVMADIEITGEDLELLNSMSGRREKPWTYTASDLGDAVAKVAQSATFNFADDIASFAGYSETGDMLRNRAERLDRDHPFISTGLDIGTGMLVGGGIGGLAAKGASRAGLSRVAQMLGRPQTLTGTVARSGAENALYEAGNALNEESLTDGAARVLAGGGLGALGGYGGEKLTQGAANFFGKSAAARRLANELRAARYDDVDAQRAVGVLQKAEEIGTPITLAESFQHQAAPHIAIEGDKLTSQARALATTNSANKRKQGEFLANRRAGSTERINSALEIVHPTGTLDSVDAAEIARKAASNQEVVYKGKAYNLDDLPVELGRDINLEPEEVIEVLKAGELFDIASREVPEVSPEGQSIIDSLRASSGEFQALHDRAARRHREHSPYSLKVLHATQKAIDNVTGKIKPGASSFDQDQLISLGSDRRALNSLLRTESPTFSQAVDVFAEVAKTSKLREKMQREVVPKENYDHIRKLIESSERQREIRDAIGQEGLDELKTRLGLEKRALSGEYLLKGNSSTAEQQQEMGRAIGRVAQTLQDAAWNPPLAAVRGLGYLATRVSPRTQEEMFDMLMSTGQKGIDALSEIQRTPERGTGLKRLAEVLAYAPRSASPPPDEPLIDEQGRAIVRIR